MLRGHNKRRRERIETQSGTVAEWLRRLLQVQLGSARAGSNPVSSEDFFLFFFWNFAIFAQIFNFFVFGVKGTPSGETGTQNLGQQIFFKISKILEMFFWKLWNIIFSACLFFFWFPIGCKHNSDTFLTSHDFWWIWQFFYVREWGRHLPCSEQCVLLRGRNI